MPRIGNVYRLKIPNLGSTQNMKEERWLELRRGGIGGSDIGAVMGLSPYSSAFEVWCDKKGMTKPMPMNVDLEFGIHMEPVLRAWTQERINVEAEAIVLASPYLYRAPDDPRAIANIDGVICFSGTEIPVGLEIKTASVYQEKAWEGEEIPDHYYAQMQWYMRVTGLQSWTMAALVGKRFFLRDIPRNPAFIEQQIQSAAAFNQMLDEGTMPAPAGTESDLDILLEMFPNASDQVIEDAGMEAVLAEYKDLQESIKKITDRKDQLKAGIEQRIGEAKGLLAGAWKASWSRYDVSRTDGEKLKTDYPEVYEACKKTNKQGRLTVSENKPKKGKESKT